MIIKGATFLLVAIAILAMLGGLRRRKLTAGKCPDCGRPRIGRGPCPCSRGRV